MDKRGLYIFLIVTFVLGFTLLYIVSQTFYLPINFSPSGKNSTYIVKTPYYTFCAKLRPKRIFLSGDLYIVTTNDEEFIIPSTQKVDITEGECR